MADAFEPLLGAGSALPPQDPGASLAGVEVDEFVTAAAGVRVSAFNDGKLAGGRRAEGTFPKLCIPCLRGTAFF